MFSHLTHQELQTILSDVKPLELKGMALFDRGEEESGLFPSLPPSEELIDATVELIDYTWQCAISLNRVNALPPVPLTAVAVEAFSL